MSGTETPPTINPLIPLIIPPLPHIITATISL